MPSAPTSRSTRRRVGGGKRHLDHPVRPAPRQPGRHPNRRRRHRAVCPINLRQRCDPRPRAQVRKGRAADQGCALDEPRRGRHTDCHRTPMRGEGDEPKGEQLEGRSARGPVSRRALGSRRRWEQTERVA